MKKLTMVILTAGMFVAAGGFIFTSCTKEGPQGPAGTNGINAAATCQECHSFSDTIVAKIFQYDASKHASGSTLAEASRTACAPCHTSQGFTQTLASGADTTLTPITDAAPINCRTCHQIHKTYTSSDWHLATTAAISLRMDHTRSINLAADGGSSNLCGKCHQVRTAASPALTDPTSTVDSLQITSATKRWGPHHGPQSNIIAGVGAYNDASFESSPHKDTASCMDCHGSFAVGNTLGGHTLLMTSGTTENVAACQPCHGTQSSFNIHGRQAEIIGKYQALKVKLAEANMLDTVNMVLFAPKYYKQKALAVYWNFMMVDADRSMGVHNYLYTLGILDDGLSYFTKGY